MHTITKIAAAVALVSSSVVAQAEMDYKGSAWFNGSPAVVAGIDVTDTDGEIGFGVRPEDSISFDMVSNENDDAMRNRKIEIDCTNHTFAIPDYDQSKVKLIIKQPSGSEIEHNGASWQTYSVQKGKYTMLLQYGDNPMDTPASDSPVGYRFSCQIATYTVAN